MKTDKFVCLGLGALLGGTVAAQECPAGYTMSVMYSTITVTAGTSATPTTSIDEYTTSITTSASSVMTSDTTVNAVEESATTSVSSASSSTTAATSTTGSEASVTSAMTLALGSPLSGQATFYGGNVAGGACSFSTYTLPWNIFGTALSDSNWDNSANCGACVSVTGPSGNSILAMIVDECPGCGQNHLDLFEDAFTELAPASEGIIDVTWEYVACPISSPLQLVNKDGVSAYWFSMQVVNANEPVSSLEVSTDGGSTWLSTTRQSYNFFEISSGTGTTTAEVKVTSSTGESVVVSDVTISSGSSTTASSNF